MIIRDGFCRDCAAPLENPQPKYCEDCSYEQYYKEQEEWWARHCPEACEAFLADRPDDDATCDLCQRPVAHGDSILWQEQSDRIVHALCAARHPTPARSKEEWKS